MSTRHTSKEKSVPIIKSMGQNPGAKFRAKAGQVKAQEIQSRINTAKKIIQAR